MDIVTYALCKKLVGNVKGDTGEKGDTGLTPNIQIGDVITLESGQQATVVRRGDDENPVFDFAIPKGEDGKDGIFVGSVDDAPEHAQIVINDDPSPYDLFYEDANVSYMGDTYTSLKEKADADIEYLLRKFGTQHYEGTNITATDTYAKQVKDAMFKGQTLVNMIAKSRLSNSVLEGTSTSLTDNKTMIINEFTYEPSSGKKYLLFLDIFENTSSRITLSWRGKNLKHLGNTNMPNLTGVTGKHYFVVTVPTLNDSIESFSIKNENGDGVITINHRFMFVEYQDGMENQDIPYFKGMASVKDPTVKTVGKNLFNYSDVKAGTIVWNTSENVNIFENEWYSNLEYDKGFMLRSCIKVKPNTKYYTDFPHQMHFMQYKANGDLIKGNYPTAAYGYITTTSETHYINLFPVGGISNQWTEERRQEFQNCYISESSAMSMYEPYKTHTLTLDGDYRGIGDVCDTVDLITGEVVERIGEIVLDDNKTNVGTILRQKGSSFAVIRYSNLGLKNASPILSDKLRKVNYYLSESFSIGDFSTDAVGWGFAVCFANNETATISEAVSYLNNLSPTIVGVLDKNIIKTVDLKNQKVYSYDGTTYYTTASAQGHPAPILSIDVPTNTTKMIARQREEIEHQEQKLQEQEEVQNVLIESQLAWYEQTLLLNDNQEIPSHIQKLYEVAYKRGIRIKEGEI